MSVIFHQKLCLLWTLNVTLCLCCFFKHFKYLTIENCVTALASVIPKLKNKKMFFYLCFVIIVIVIPLERLQWLPGCSTVWALLSHSRKVLYEHMWLKSIAVSCSESIHSYTETHLMNTTCTSTQVRTCTVSTVGNKVKPDLILPTHTHTLTQRVLQFILFDGTIVHTMFLFTIEACYQS